MASNPLPLLARLLIGGLLTLLFVAYGAMGGVLWLAAASVESSLRGDWSRLQAEWQHIFKGTPALLCGGLLGLGAGALWSAMVLWRTGCVAGKRLANCLRFLGKGVLWGLISGALYSGLGYVVLELFAGWSLVGAIFGLIYPPVGGLLAGFAGGILAGLLSLLPSKAAEPSVPV